MGGILLLLVLASGDWPHLRGPEYDGVSGETKLAERWPGEGPPRLWARELGQGHSGFIVAEGRLYTQRQTLTSQFLVCLDPGTGDVLWETRYDWSWQPRGAYPGPYASPTWYRGKVVVASPAGRVGCVDGRTGEFLWSVNVREKFQGAGFGFGYAITPTVEDGRVILPVGGPNASLVALDVETGATLWASGSDPASYCPALPITFEGRGCVVGYLQNAWVIVEASTGKMLHRQTLSTGYDEHSAWPLYREPHLLMTAPFRAQAVCHRLEAAPEGNLRVVPQWSRKDFANDVASSVLVGEHVYGFDVREAQSNKYRPTRGVFRCLEWNTGRTCWSAEGVGQACTVAADGKLFLLNDAGTLILADADPREYRERGRVQVFEDEVCWTPPTLHEGRLFVRSPSRAVCLWVGRAGDLAPETPRERVSPARSWRFDGTWLVSREREYPNDAFAWEELGLWFAVCVGIMGLAGLAAFALGGQRLGVFLGGTFLLGLLGPNLLSVPFDRLVFTWPVSLYAAFHATLVVGRWSRERGSGWGRVALLGLVVVCLGYLELCRSVGMFTAWAFLAGFPAALGFTWLAVEAQGRKRWLWAGVWTLVAFVGFYWTAPVVLLWKVGAGG